MPEIIVDGTGSGYFAGVTEDNRLKVDVSGLSLQTGSNVWVQNFPSTQIVTISGTPIVDKVSSYNTFVGSVAMNGSWVGTYEDILNYSSISILTRPEATGSLYVDFSINGSDAIRTSYLYSVSGTNTYNSISARTQFFRLRYMNDGTINPITINTLLSDEARGATYLPVIAPLTDNYTVLSTRAVLSAKSATGSYVNIDCTNGGNLKVSIEDWNGVVGSVYSFKPIPTSLDNSYVQLDYVSSGTSTGIDSGSAIGSIIKYIGAGSYVRVLTYSNNNLIAIGSWI